MIAYSNARKRLKEVMDRVVAGRQPVVIARHNAEAVVMVSLADWHAIEETMHLLSSPANAQRVNSAIEELNEDSGSEHQLIES